MIPPTLAEHRAWQAAHGRNYTDQPIRKRIPTIQPDPPGNPGSVDNITRILEGKETA